MKAQEFIKEMKNFASMQSQLIRDIVDSIPLTIKIYFYGSRARGDYKKTSDYDFLVIVPDNIFGSDFLDVQLELDRIGQRYKNFDVQASHHDSLLTREAEKDGKLIYASQPG